MIATLLFTGVAAGLVFLAGRGDKARDPRLTVMVLGVLAVFPFLAAMLPKVAILPAAVVGGSAGSFPWLAVISGVWTVGLAVWGISRWRRESVFLGKIEGVEIRQLSSLRGPVAAGVLWPIIFVPESWGDWSAEARKIVLDHELGHHRRKDPLWRWIAEISCAIHGYNPLVVWMSRRLTMQCECACDALVLKKGVSAHDYVRVLCDMAASGKSQNLALAMADGSSLESRVRRLASPHSKMGAASLAGLMVLALGLAGIVATLAPRKPWVVPVSKAEVELRWAADAFPDEE